MPPLSKEETAANAALRAFSLYGYQRMSMEDIAQGAGLSRAALYLRFRNKKDIFATLCVNITQQRVIGLRSQQMLIRLVARAVAPTSA